MLYYTTVRILGIFHNYRSKIMKINSVIFSIDSAKNNELSFHIPLQ